MTPQMTDEEIELDREWRLRFGEPLPILGCADIVHRILRSSPEEMADWAA